MEMDDNASTDPKRSAEKNSEFFEKMDNMHECELNEALKRNSNMDIEEWAQRMTGPGYSLDEARAEARKNAEVALLAHHNEITAPARDYMDRISKGHAAAEKQRQANEARRALQQDDTDTNN